MQCTTRGCDNTTFVIATTAYLNIDLSSDGGHTVEIEAIGSDDIELVCRECGNPVDDNDFSFDKAVQQLIMDLHRDMNLPLPPVPRTYPDGTLIAAREVRA